MQAGGHAGDEVNSLLQISRRDDLFVASARAAPIAPVHEQNQHPCCKLLQRTRDADTAEHRAESDKQSSVAAAKLFLPSRSMVALKKEKAVLYRNHCLNG